MKHEYYSGAEAIADYLRPKTHTYTPLVELPAPLNPYLKKYDIHIDAKLMSALPLGNVKALPAWHMLEQEADGVRGIELVEASSGNTVFSLGVLAPLFGAKKVQAIASPEVSEGKLTLLKLAGVHVRLIRGPICPDPHDPDGAIAAARREGALPGKKNLGQYDNMANPSAHERITGPQLYTQLGGTIGLVVAGLGTTGTLLGTARFLKKRLSHIKIAGVVRAPNNLIPGVRTVNGLKEVAFQWSDVLTEPLMEVSEKAAYHASLQLIRSGLLVGPSAGFAYRGLLKHLERLEKAGELEALRGTHAVFICPDTPFPYASEYEKILGANHFPIVENSHLREQKAYEHKNSTRMVPEMTVETVYKLYTGDTPETMVAPSMVLVDVREPEEYEDHHMPASSNVPLATLPSWLKRWPDDDRRQVVFICKSGNRSQRAAYLARQMGVNAYNLVGGTSEWSAKNYPRVVSAQCSL